MTYDLKKLKNRFKTDVSKSKEMLDIASSGGRIELDLSALGMSEKEAKAFRQKVMEQIRSKVTTDLANRVPSLEELERRGFQYGTPEQSWFALGEMARAIAANEPVPAHAGLWFLNALNSSKEMDPHDLLKNLGLVNPGRGRVVNKFDVAARMTELVDGGMLREHAALKVAEEFDCSRATALHYYKFRKEIYDSSEKGNK